MDVAELEAAYEQLLQVAADCDILAPSGEDWGVDTILAHVVASSRMLAAASAELLSGRIPVVDNRPTQSRQYLDAIVSSAGDRGGLLRTVKTAGHELVLLVSQLDDELLAASVPTIIVDAGRFRVERPVQFRQLLEADHVREHIGQLTASAGNPVSPANPA